MTPPDSTEQVQIYPDRSLAARIVFENRDWLQAKRLVRRGDSIVVLTGGGCKYDCQFTSIGPSLDGTKRFSYTRVAKTHA